MDENAENPYRGPSSTAAKLESEAPTAEELQAFFGEDDDHYRPLWQWSEERTPWFAGFNWAAFLFFMPWCLYRKLFAALALAWLFLIIVSFVLALSQPVGTILMLGTLLSFGFLGNGLLFRRARKVIARYRRQVADPEERLRRISKAGGTSRLALALGILVFVAPAFLDSVEGLVFWLLVAVGVYWLSTRRGLADEAAEFRRELYK